MYRVSYNPMNGRLTTGCIPLSYEVAKTDEGSNHWCCSENNRNNARNVNFSNGNANNNNKYNGNVVRPVAAFKDYDVPASFVESVWDAYFDCLKGKMHSTQAVEYMEEASRDIPVLAGELWSGAYSPGVSTCFLVHYPKLREVFAAGFRDRIIHHWICMRLEPLFEQRFVSQGNVSFNCRKGFGTDAAVEHVAYGMRRVSDNYHNGAYVFKGDLVGFFMSIDKGLLWYLLERFITRWRKRVEREGWKALDSSILARLGMDSMPEMYWDILLAATKAVVMHHPEDNCVFNTNPKEWLKLAPNKSLFTSPTGEPIGNLTTQQFANFLMSYFVLFVKRLYSGRNYCFAQFVDDFIIVCDDKRFIIDSIPKIEEFLKSKLLLSMHKDKRYFQPVGHGVAFVGSYIKPSRIYLSNRTVERMMERMHGFANMLEEGCDLMDAMRIEQVLNSYMGFTKNSHRYNFKKEQLQTMPHGFWKYFYVKGRYRSVKMKKCFKL